MDNHADIHCFVRNISPISFTSEECMVAPFPADYYEQLNIPICIGSTAYIMELGEFIILIIGQGLWFGNRIEKTLINTNQRQDSGIPICDEPTDKHRPLGIEEYFNIRIPMSMVESTCGFITWYPTYEKIETCRHNTVSDEHNWDP